LVVEVVVDLEGDAEDKEECDIAGDAEVERSGDLD